MEEKEEKQLIPEKWRVTPELLSEADAQQILWKQQTDIPAILLSPRERERANAQILIETLLVVRDVQGLAGSQIEQLAEAYAILGRYDLAHNLTADAVKQEIFDKYLSAVWLDDAEWCEHPDDKKYVREQVYSVKEGKEMPLLACNVCGTWNVIDAPEHLVKGQSKRSLIRNSRPKDMSIEESLNWHKRNFGK